MVRKPNEEIYLTSNYLGAGECLSSLLFARSKDDRNELVCGESMLYTRRVSKDGKSRSLPNPFMPDIERIEVVTNYKSKIIKMFFADGTMEKAVQSANDVYSFDVGITICLIKKLLSIISGGQGTALYNKLVSRANKIYEKAEERKKRELAEKAVAETRYKKYVEKKERKRKQREEEAMQTIVDALAAAIVKAREIESGKGD